MIQPSEIRLGNWIKHIDNQLKVIDINPHMICCEPHWGFDNVEDIDGIPLTPEILLKCCKSWRSFHDGVVIYEFGKIEFWSQNGQCWLEKHNNNILPDNCKYLHQLQNLYYALIGQELTITL